MVLSRNSKKQKISAYDRCSQICTKSFQFKFTIIVFALVNLLSCIIAAIFSIRKWNETNYSIYIKVVVVDVILADVVINALIHFFGVICLISISRKFIISFICCSTVVVFLSFTIVWISFSNKKDILNQLQTKYNKFNEAEDITIFEGKMKCCGWEFLTERCRKNVNLTLPCLSAVTEITNAASDLSGDLFIVCVIIQLAQLMYLFFIIICYSGFDWKEIKPISQQDKEELIA